MDIKILDSHVRSMLSEKRYNHSIGVADTAKKLAKLLGADEEKAYTAGLLHDCAKEIEPETALKRLKAYGITVDEVSLSSPALLHGPLGACIAQIEFGISDPEIFDAIWFHTTGKAAMNTLTKIIYIADYIEPSREFESVDKLRELAFSGKLDEAIVKAAGRTIQYSIEKGRTIHPDTVHARNYILINQHNEQ